MGVLLQTVIGIMWLLPEMALLANLKFMLMVFLKATATQIVTGNFSSPSAKLEYR